MTGIFFVLTPNYLVLDHAGMAEAMRIAIDEGAALSLHTVGPVADCINSLGLVSRLDPLPARIPEQAMLVLVGTMDEDRDYSTPAALQVIDWLRQVTRADTQITCICSGALLAARAGLLDGHRCTTHHRLTDRLARLAPLARVEENRIFVEDGRVATSAGITAGIDLALWLIESLAGSVVAARVARRMVIYVRRDGSMAQQSPWMAHRNHLHPALHKAQDLIADNPAQRWTLEQLADRVHVSARHLARLFRIHAGTSLVEYRHSLQIGIARTCLAQGATVAEASETAGFASTRDFRRVWQQREEGTPVIPPKN